MKKLLHNVFFQRRTWKLLFKRILIVFFIVFLNLSYLSAKTYPIDAEKNAQKRNNSGILYLKDRDYFAAIAEFKIAIAINPNHQTSAIYYNNLGTAYLGLAKIQKEHNLPKDGADFAHFAQISFESAIKQDCMQLSFYKNLVTSFELQNILKSKRSEYIQNNENPLNTIVVALIDERLGNIENMKIALDDFIVAHPNLIIVTSLKDYLRMKEEKK